MHQLKIDIISPEDNSVVKSGVTMETDGKLSVSETVSYTHLTLPTTPYV